MLQADGGKVREAVTAREPMTARQAELERHLLTGLNQAEAAARMGVRKQRASQIFRQLARRAAAWARFGDTPPTAEPEPWLGGLLTETESAMQRLMLGGASASGAVAALGLDADRAPGLFKGLARKAAAAALRGPLPPDAGRAAPGTRAALLALLALAAAPACRKGPHVDVTTVTTTATKYRCSYSESVWQSDRTLAICDTAEECVKACAAAGAR